jgi:lipid-A-disaccharide synthase
MKIFFSVGEPSGDLHGANLIRQMRQIHPDVQAVGYGGPRMAAAGCRLHEDLTKLAVMWLVRVLLNIHQFWGLVSKADRYFRHQRPDAIVLIDYPGMNWWIARRAKAHGIPVFYYGTPQMWAWGGWRVKKMRRLVDHVLCKLPFEVEWFHQRGCRATFLGHPYFDELRQATLDESFVRQQQGRAGRLVTILPGSRVQEVVKNLPWFLRAARRLQQTVPDVRFAVASFNEQQAEIARRLAAGSTTKVEIHCGKTTELIHLAHCCMACSGSVSLELLYHQKPSVIQYRINWAFYYFIHVFFRLLQIRVKYITLVNMLGDEPFTERLRPFDPLAADANKAIFPEFTTCTDKTEWIVHYLAEWLTDPQAYAQRVARLADLKAEVAHGGASVTAARYILDQLGQRAHTVPRPHFLPDTADRRVLARTGMVDT